MPSENMKRSLLFVVAITLVLASMLFFINFPKKNTDRPIQSVVGVTDFEERFDDVTSLSDLMPQDLTRWHGVQRESSTNPEENRVEISTEQAHSGKHSLKLFAVPYQNRVASKADIQKENFLFKTGDDFWFSGWFYIDGNTNTDNVFLIDIEDTANYKSPGRRLWLSGGGDYLVSDLGKSSKSHMVRQNPFKKVPFPKNRWVYVKMHLYLSSDKYLGKLEVWQDNIKVLDAHTVTIPTQDSLFTRLQVGITANGNETHAQTIYVDDIKVSSNQI